MSIGEAGSLTVSSAVENTPITVTLSKPIPDPVFALTGTSDGTDPYTLRIIDQTIDGDGNTTAFTFIIKEWEYLDGGHAAEETINWIAVKEGVHELPDGRIIEAGTTEADHTNTAVALTGGFADPPVVVTSVMSNNDTVAVDSDPLNITAGGFNLRLEEEEAQDGIHDLETVGWIAIEGGGDNHSGTADTHDGVTHRVQTLDLGATFTNAVVIGDSQTRNGGDSKTEAIDSQTNTTADMFVREEQSRDSEIAHTRETFGVVTFEEGLIPCLTAGTLIQTPGGLRPVERLQEGNAVSVHTSGTGETGEARALIKIFRRRIGARELARNPRLLPVRIQTGALGNGLPHRDLLVSRQHRMLVSSKIAERMFGAREVLIAAIRLTELPGIFVDESVRSVGYFHLLFEQHEVIFAEGAPTESFFTGKEALKALPRAARDELFAIFPEIEARDYTPLPARPIPTGRFQKNLVRRHKLNARVLL